MLASIVFRDLPEAGLGPRTYVACPLCTFDRQHLVDSGPKDGSVFRMVFEGGCGCLWHLDLRDVDGRTESRVVVQRPCIHASGLRPLDDPEEAAALLADHEL
ncbi:hypothetical protein [Sinimarinibacterium flocculans]|uniref:hypothetical protein n=1 Tax=Sinimarinibacterium flocculans TaxID=985250 RepID=UPI002490EBAE|nr:hypothetical protein [Sinimarinibacterium flocculans]